MAYLIDTCILSELRKRTCDPVVRRWMSALRPTDAFISVLTLGEIRRESNVNGLRTRPPRPGLSNGCSDWRPTMQTVSCPLPQPSQIIGRLCPNQPLPVTDGLLAATGIEHQLTIVTRNTSDRFVTS